MHRTLLLFLTLLVCGCASMSPGQQTAAWIAGGVAAIAISSDGDSGDPVADPRKVPCRVQPDGSCR